MFNFLGVAFLGLAFLLSGCVTMPREQCLDHLVGVERSPAGRLQLDADDQRVFAYQKCRASNGDKEALLWLGGQFEKGSALVEVNMEKAFEFYLKAAHDDPTKTSVYVPGIKGAPGTIMNFNNPSAKTGLSEAKYRTGLMCVEGRGTVQSTRRGWRWMRQAARAGHKSAIDWLHTFDIRHREMMERAEGSVGI